MHIPDGFLDPKISFGLMGAAVAVLGYCFAKVKAAVTAMVQQPAFAAVGKGIKSLAGGGRRALTKLGEQKIYLMGMVAALIFAAQMFNFPIGQGTSGHLLGGVLAVVLLGPFAGTLVIAVVLGVQSIFFADGGLLALGANIINMAVFGSLVSYYLYAGLRKYLNEQVSIGISAWLSVVLAAFVCSIEVGFSGTIGFGLVIPAMFKVHAVIGIAEALITVVLINVFRKMVPIPEEQAA